MKTWRTVAVPHPDVLEGTFQQSEFAADLSAVHAGRAKSSYQDPLAFYQRTFITEGMRLLLTSVAKRLNGQGGDPVIQLQTAFGGGKSHTMLAVYHLATRTCSLNELQGIPDLLDKAQLLDVPRAQVAVLDGNALSPGQPWKRGSQTIKTLWGELAWQLGRDEGYALVAESDLNGKSPGKEVLRHLLEMCAPCVVLIDEMVAYLRQLSNDQSVSGGTYDNNLSFVQALTEAAKLVPNVIILASLPESEIEAGSTAGVSALKALEKTFGRVQALWKPVATEESFEIVRRRLFNPITDTGARDAVCRAFAQGYVTEGAKFPSETQESRYFDRLMHAYPIHPEVFDRLYEDWTTLEGFQRTRGVLKLMAKVIHRLWKDENQDLLILPGSLPLYDSDSRNELVQHLQVGWDAVLEKDIDGDRAETTELEAKEPRFGATNAARRVARTLFLGSAPSSVRQGVRGIDRGRVLLGCFQPGQTASVYSDALNRLSDRLHYLNSSGDKAADTTRFWFDTRANLRREMEDRKSRFNEQSDVRGKIAEVLKRVSSGISMVDGVHIFTPHSDVPDDSALRLVFLTADKFFTKQEQRYATEEVLSFLKSNGSKPRHRANRLLFVAPDHAIIGRMREAARTVLAWNSIVEDVKDGRLNIDRLQEQQARKELQTAEDVLPRVVRECYKWLLCPRMDSATDKEPLIEDFQLNSSGASFGAEFDRQCHETGIVISTWSPIHLRTMLQSLYWKPDVSAVKAMTVWADMEKYLFLERLRNREVLAQAIIKGAATQDFFGTAYGQSGDSFDGFKLGDTFIQVDDTLLLIEPEVARQYFDRVAKVNADQAQPTPTPGPAAVGNTGMTVSGTSTRSPGSDYGRPIAQPARAREYHGTVDVSLAAAKMQLLSIDEELLSQLRKDPQARVTITLEISAEFPEGVSDDIKRAVSENGSTLKFKINSWE